ncbi:hypothetical protein [Streptomyces sp. NPDC052015]|uniref:hypothetical protein n=1 Tax=Streptomyces sp. NPDC052015 TaxID=3154755 RepID=UPI00343B3C03
MLLLTVNHVAASAPKRTAVAPVNPAEFLSGCLGRLRLPQQEVDAALEGLGRLAGEGFLAGAVDGLAQPGPWR